MAKILDQHGRPFAAPKQSPRDILQEAMRLRARYDAAQITDDNRRHWANADGLSAKVANNPEVRRKLRNHARYESANNSYLHGMMLQLANDLIGTGPRLQLHETEILPARAARMIEVLFADWAREIDLASKLRTMRRARGVDGEAFCVFVTNRKLRHPVKLDLRLVEAEQIAGSWSEAESERYVDGIHFDELGNPISYDFLPEHPGGHAHTLLPEKLSAEQVIHYFRVDRPGQARGVPDCMPALPLFALLRRFTLATLHAAESAASLALFMHTDAAPGEEDEVSPFLEIEFERNSMTSLPLGWKPSHLKPEHPSTTYAEFKKEILNEASRCLLMSFNVAAGTSEDYNYSSGRLDWISYYKSIQVERECLERSVIDRILRAWFLEAVLIEDLLPQSLRMRDARVPPAYRLMWDGMLPVDPSKETSADISEVQAGLTTESAYHAKRGNDWEAMLEQQAREAKKRVALGLAPVVQQSATEAEFKATFDSYGVAVRAGAVSPQRDDEAQLRQMAKLPPMSADVEAAWREEPVRRPITLAEDESDSPQPAKPTPANKSQRKEEAAAA